MPTRKKIKAPVRGAIRKNTAAGLDLNHVMIYCRDVERSLAFYRDVLGLEPIESMPGYARLRAPRGNGTVGLHGLESDRALDPKARGCGSTSRSTASTSSARGWPPRTV